MRLGLIPLTTLGVLPATLSKEVITPPMNPVRGYNPLLVWRASNPLLQKSAVGLHKLMPSKVSSFGREGFAYI
uniref:Uncharacterized protein n=1 Tax=Utricularia reniformis TaxID=192314 RepID=A0A1Y0AZ10_9LAMI|nr:hypothetical protein AEK19_MT1615 [Utricularia reniformis]ART30393.1 hypothetical protein AEK19_MT1615 [Utricularia reniformis]